MSVILTTTVVAFLTGKGHLYTTEFTDNLLLRETSRTKLPSSQLRGASGREGTIVLAMGAPMQGEAMITEILIYETTIQRLRSFRVCDACQSQGGSVRSVMNCSVLVNSNRTIDIFNLILERNRAHEVSEMSLSSIRVSATDGEVLKKDRFFPPPVFKKSYSTGHFGMFPPRPTGRKGQFQSLVTEQPSRRLSEPIRVKHIAHFDTDRAVFVDPDQDAVLRQTAIDDHGVRPLLSSSPLQGERHYVRWKDLAVVRIQDSQDWAQHIALMNDTFLLSVETIMRGTGLTEPREERCRIRVFCFDGNFKMRGAVSTGF